MQEKSFKSGISKRVIVPVVSNGVVIVSFKRGSIQWNSRSEFALGLTEGFSSSI